MAADMKYAGFWRRLGAGLIDFCVFLPFIVLHAWAFSVSLTIGVLVSIVSSFLYPGYSIYFHGRFGQTIGKMAMKIRVISQNGAPLAWSQACYRSSVELLLSLAQTATLMVAASRIPGAGYDGSNWTDRAQRLEELTPYTWELMVLTNVWVWSELVIMLTNKQRRALHDFIGGSIVVPRSHNQPVELRPLL
jgi:uncharacterized RDD family membrane protein YckC